ncbi:hypothetical protein RND81_09G123700 [Saponaria officinalis]|uniref:Uncharacterized protein n=1 Tax=Saponaria officinalis TaxID=3572 RepID=A0AAW1IM18_SAPOF
MSCSVLSSQSVIITTAMAVSGVVILLSLCKIKNLPTIQQLPFNQNSSSLRSCLSSGKLKGNNSKRKKKKVKFAEDVKEEIIEVKKKKNDKIIRTKKMSEFCNMPANRAALYHGILRDRLHRVESY